MRNLFLITLTLTGFALGMDLALRTTQSELTTRSSTSCSTSDVVKVQPKTIHGCDTVKITSDILLECPMSSVHVVFIFPSRLPEHQWSRTILNKAIETVQAVPGVKLQVGAIMLQDAIIRDSFDLSTDVDQAKNWIDQRMNRSGNDMMDGLRIGTDQASKMFAVARSNLSQKPLEIAIIFQYEKEHEVTRPRFLDDLNAVRRLRTQDIRVFAACPARSNTPLCDRCRELAASPRNFTAAPDETTLARVIGEETTSFASIPAIEAMSLEHRLPGFLEYVDNSANVPPAFVTRTVTDTVLTWQWPDPEPSKAVSVTFQAKPLSEGVGTITGKMALTEGGVVQPPVVLSSQPITVTGLCAPPTATPTDTPEPTPIPTITPIPTRTPTPTSTPSPAATPTPQLSPVYLPIALLEACSPERQRLAVALVLDTSSSMGEPTSAGRSKLAAAQGAAQAMLDALRLGDGDLAAVITFNQSAHLVQGLTSDRRSLDAALGGITLAPQTCLVCGVDAGAAELLGGGRPASHLAVLVVLTDGRSNPRPASEAVARAAEAKARGVELYTVGIGEDVDDEALAAMASRPASYYRTPDAEALGQVFAEIARLIPCPPSAFWGGR